MKYSMDHHSQPKLGHQQSWVADFKVPRGAEIFTSRVIKLGWYIKNLLGPPQIIMWRNSLGTHFIEDQTGQLKEVGVIVHAQYCLVDHAVHLINKDKILPCLDTNISCCECLDTDSDRIEWAGSNSCTYDFDVETLKHLSICCT
jgi:hypothetical protein